MFLACDDTCENGGQCFGGNVCKCPSIFTGPKCEQPVHRSPDNLLELIGQPSEETEMEVPKKSNLISLPLVLSLDNGEDEESSNQKTLGRVDQRKLVDILSQFSRNLPAFVPALDKRSRIPRNGPYSRLQQLVYKER